MSFALEDSIRAATPRDRPPEPSAPASRITLFVRNEAGGYTCIWQRHGPQAQPMELAVRPRRGTNAHHAIEEHKVRVFSRMPVLVAHGRHAARCHAFGNTKLMRRLPCFPSHAHPNKRRFWYHSAKPSPVRHLTPSQSAAATGLSSDRSRRRASQRAGGRVILATSAMHAPRAAPHPNWRGSLPLSTILRLCVELHILHQTTCGVRTTLKSIMGA